MKYCYFSSSDPFKHNFISHCRLLSHWRRASRSVMYMKRVLLINAILTKNKKVFIYGQTHSHAMVPPIGEQVLPKYSPKWMKSFHWMGVIMRKFGLCGLGDQNSANVCPCACRKRRPTTGYKLFYTTGLLYSWFFCMQ